MTTNHHLFIHTFRNRSKVALLFRFETNSFKQHCHGKVPETLDEWEPFRVHVQATLSDIFPPLQIKKKGIKFSKKHDPNSWN